MSCGEACGDNRFDIIERAKNAIIKGTNISSSKDEMQVLDNILFRAWQMGWLGKYDYEGKISNLLCEHCKCRTPKCRLQRCDTWKKVLSVISGNEVKQ